MMDVKNNIRIAIYNTKVTETNKNKEDCESIQIYDDSNNWDSKSKCVFNAQTKVCSKANKECSDYSAYSCKAFTPSNENKRCTLIGEKCQEIFNTCELYDKEETKNQETCEKIIPYITDSNTIDEHSKCVFNDNNKKCKRKKKACSELTHGICNNQVLEDKNKKCVYVYHEDNEECKEEYKSCDSFNNFQNKNDKDCERIILFDTNGNVDYENQCILEEGQCKQKNWQNALIT